MAQEAVVRHVHVNPCCELLQKKESKLLQKLAKSEESRNFLRKAVGILEQKIANFEAEKIKLQEQLELAHKKAQDGDGEKNNQDFATNLDKEMSALRSEISSLKQKEKLAHSEWEKEISILKEQLNTEQTRAMNEQKMAEIELNKANQALQTAKAAETARVEKLQADNEREMKMNESTIRVSLEHEISALKSHITVLQQQTASAAQDANKEATLLQECVSEQKQEINRLKQLLKIEKDRADSEKKKAQEAREKADDEKYRAQKLLSERETELSAKESAVRVSLEDEISSLKSQIALLQETAVLGAEDVNKDINLLRDCISNKEKEINQLHELLQNEKDRAYSEKKKAETEKCRADKVLADSEITLKEKEQAVRLSLGAEISALESQIPLLQQEIAVEKKEVNLYQSLVSEKEAEINQLKKLAEKERTRAESEKKKVEAGKQKVNESQRIAKTEKSRADEERRLADIERKKVKEAGLQLEMLRAEGHDLRANLESEALKVQQENEILETEKQKVMAERQRADKIAKTEKSRADEERRLADIERKKVKEAGLQLEMLRAEVHDLRANLESEALKVQQEHEILETEKQKVMAERQRADMEMAKAEEQSKLLEITRREIAEERARADSLSLQLEEDRVRIMKLQKEIAELVSPRNTGKMVLNCLQCEELIKKLKDVKQEAKKEKERADSEMRKAEYQRKVADTHGEKAKMETDRCLELANELEDNRCKTEKLKKEMQELVSSGKLVDTVERKNRDSDTTNMKLLRKSLKLERMQKKHAKQVASLERDRNILLQHEIRRIKEVFSGITDQLDLLDKCSSHGDVGINDLEKNSNVPRRQGRKRKFLDEEPCQVHHSGNELMKSSSPLLLSSKECPEPLSGIESAEHMYREGKKRCRQITESVSVLQDMLECSIGKRFGETGGLLPSINCANQEIKNPVSREELAMQHLNMSEDLKTHSHPTHSRPMSDVTGITHACNEETGDASMNYVGSFDEVEVGSFDEVEDGNYLKFLSLDNPLDEEIYRVAIERPLSPTLPEIRPSSVGAHENDNNDHIDVVSPVSNNVDIVVSRLIKKLHNYVISNVSYQDLREATAYMNDEGPSSNEKREPGDGEISCVQCGKFNVPCSSHKARMSTSSETVSCETLLDLGDVISSLELLASITNWSWSFTNIVLKLLDILDSCDIKKKLVPAIVVLLGQLGRLGVDANGYDDTRVETLRGRLSTFLHPKASTITEFSFQIATVTALLGVIPLRFEELIKSTNELQKVVKDSSPADCIRNWFSLLSKEHRSLSVKLLLNM